MRLTLDAISGSGGGDNRIASQRAPHGRHGPRFQGIYRKMSGHRIVAALAIASALAFGVTTQASASPILGMSAAAQAERLPSLRPQRGWTRPYGQDFSRSSAEISPAP